MNFKKILLWVSGAFSAIMLVSGRGLVLLPKTVAVVVGVVISCLSLAEGLILADPSGIIGLILGILFIFVPKEIAVAILIAMEIIGATATLIISLRSKKQESTT